VLGILANAGDISRFIFHQDFDCLQGAYPWLNKAIRTMARQARAP